MEFFQMTRSDRLCSKVGTYLFVNFMQEKIAMTPETKCVETLVVTAVTVIIVAANKDMFFETRHVGRLLESVSADQTP